MLTTNAIFTVIACVQITRSDIRTGHQSQLIDIEPMTIWVPFQFRYQLISVHNWLPGDLSTNCKPAWNMSRHSDYSQLLCRWCHFGSTGYINTGVLMLAIRALSNTYLNVYITKQEIHYWVQSLCVHLHKPQQLISRFTVEGDVYHTYAGKGAMKTGWIDN